MRWTSRMVLMAIVIIAGDAFAADGDPDTGFSGDGMQQIAFSGGGIEGVKVAIDAAGRTLVAGSIRRDGINYDFAIARMMANGVLDAGFGFQGLRTAGFDLVVNGSDKVSGIFPQADGTVLVLGTAEVAEEISAQAPPAILRLTAAGNADPGFGVSGRIVVGGSPWANPGLYLRLAAQQRDGKLLFGGYCVSCPSTYRAVVVRLTAAGALDPTFGSGGWSSIPLSANNPRFEAMQVDESGRIVLAGGFSDGDATYPLIVRMTSTGAVDASFGGGTGVTTILGLPNTLPGGWTARAMTIDRDQSMVLAVSNFDPITINRTGLMRLFGDGTRDASYAGTGLRNLTLQEGSRILSLAQRSDRSVMAAGWIDRSGSAGQDFLLARVLRNGDLDTSFDGNGQLIVPMTTDNTDGAEAITLWAGKPVVAGYAYSTSRDIGVLRLQSNLIFSNGVE